MQITRITDKTDIGRIVSESGQGEIDLGALTRDPTCYVLIGDPPLGVHIGLRVIEGVYEVHSAITPDGRGEWAGQFTADAIRYMFCGTDCIELITRIPQGVLAAVVMARQFGFSRRWIGGDMVFQGIIVPYGVWSLTMMEWLPADINAFNEVIAEMAERQPKKAEAWAIRRAFVARKVDA